MKYDVNSVYYLHKHFIELKDRYEESVSHLNMMFSTTTILGLFATYGGLVHMFIGKFVFNIFDIVYIFLFVVLEDKIWLLHIDFSNLLQLWCIVNTFITCSIY